MFGINEFYTSASVLKDTTKEPVNICYMENLNKDLNLDTTTINENISTSNVANTDLSNSLNNLISNEETDNSTTKLTTTTENILKDVAIYNDIIKELKAKEQAEKEKIEKEKIEREKAEKEKKNESQKSKTVSSNSQYKATFTMEATAYSGDTTTATGVKPVRNPNGISTIAVDPNVIPLGSKVYIPGYGEAIAADTGGAIKGQRIDLFLNSEQECINWGRQTVNLYILAYPGQW